MTNLLFSLLEAAPGSKDMVPTIVMFVIMFAIIYFFFSKSILRNIIFF